MSRRVLSVAELLEGVRRLLEDSVGRVWVAGETSNVYASPAGHVYFTLKDATGQIRCACFRGDARRLRFEIENGMELVVHAEPSVYLQRGELQLVVREAEPRGAGALAIAFEQLRARLEAEGLFAPERKRALPPHPRRIAVVTSPRGAAVRDVIHVSARRWPSIPIVIVPTRVQGDGAEHEIARAIDRACELPDVDVVLVVRGGGSLEDLFCFNREEVVRAIARARVPVVSGVGHETDVTLSDFAADARAATPSAAAMLALPDGDAARGELAALWQRLQSEANAALEMRWQRLDRSRDALRRLAPAARLRQQRERWRAAARALARAGRACAASARERHARARLALAARAPSTALARERLAAASSALARALARGAATERARLERAAAQLDSLSPLRVLGRGYAVVRRAEDGRLVRQVDDAPPGVELDVRVARARLRARVVRGEPA